MTWKDFLIQLTAVSVLLALVLLVLRGSEKLAPYLDLGWITWVALLLLNILLFVVGSKAAIAENKNTFLQLVILSMLGKMMLAFFVAILYHVFNEPTDRLFILPLFIIYFGFTIFETYLMMRLGKQKGQKA